MTLSFEVVGIDDITKSPLERFTCATNDGEFIYAGSESVSGNGHVWKYSPYQGWIRITDNLNNSTAKSISTIKHHEGKLYAGTQGSSLAYGTGQLWINEGDGEGWTNPLAYWAGNTNIALRTLLFKDGDLYTAGSYFDIVKYSSAGNWSEVFGYANNFVAAGGPSSVITHDLETDGTNIYAAMTTLLTSGIVTRYDGNTWSVISPAAFGNPNNTSISKLKWYNNKLYAATFNLTTGSEVWEYDGVSWQQINVNGFGLASNFKVVSIENIDNKLLFSVEGIYGGKIFSYSDEDGWLEIEINSDVIYASYLIQKVGDLNYLVGTKRKNFITNTEPSAFITSVMKNEASAYYFPDGNIGVIPIENGKYRFFGANSIWQLVTDGTLDDPFENVRSEIEYSEYLDQYNPAASGFTVATDFLEKKNDFTYFNTAATATLELPNIRYNSGGLIHKIPDTSTVILFTHAEEGFWNEGSTSAEFVGVYFNGLIRQAVSFDNGLTFYDCGRVIHSTYPARPTNSTSAAGTGFGLGGYVIKDGYIYIYYTGDVISSGVAQPQTASIVAARAPYSEFLTSALNKSTCNWSKYYNGSFSEPGISGRATELSKYFGGFPTGWTVGLNSTTLNNICLFISVPTHYNDINDIQNPYTGIPIPGTIPWRNQSYVMLSEDGINWSHPEKISSFTTSCIYTTPLSISGNYIGELDNEFKVLGHRSAPWVYSDEQGGIVTTQQIVEVQPFRDVERGFTEGTYFNLDFTIFAKSNGQWKKSVPYCKINNSWKFAYPFLKSTNGWIESSPIRQGKEEVDLYFYIGDSVAGNAVGSAIDLLQYNEYSGLYSSVPGCYVFRSVECPQTTGEFGSFTTARFEGYRTGLNTNSIYGGDGESVGADAILFDKIRNISDNDIYILKAAVGGSRFVKENGYFDWSPRSQSEDFGDLFRNYYETQILPALNWFKANNKNPIFKGGFITLGTNPPTYVFKEEFTKEQVDADCSGLVSSLIDCFKSNNIKTEAAKIIWIAPDRVRILAGPYLTEPYKSVFSEYLNATVSSILNLSTIFNFTSGYDPSAWYQLSGNNDYVHPSTSGHVKVAETVFNNFFSGLP